jgi:hypothetical protein
LLEDLDFSLYRNFKKKIFWSKEKEATQSLRKEIKNDKK